MRPQRRSHWWRRRRHAKKRKKALLQQSPPPTHTPGERGRERKRVKKRERREHLSNMAKEEGEGSPHTLSLPPFFRVAFFLPPLFHFPLSPPFSLAITGGEGTHRGSFLATAVGTDGDTKNGGGGGNREGRPPPLTLRLCKEKREQNGINKKSVKYEPGDHFQKSYKTVFDTRISMPGCPPTLQKT